MAPQTAKQIKTALWIRDWTNLTNNTRTSNMIAGTYTLSEMYGDKDTGFYVDITITDLTPYIAGMSGKSTGTYIIDPAQDPGSISYRMKYTGSTTDYKQDGSGWTLDKTDWNSQEKNNGKTIWVIPQWTTTYTDGVDGTVFETKTIVYPTSSSDVEQNAAKNGKILTPNFGSTPQREGYLFTGWDPAVSEKLTASKTYTATWEVDDRLTVTYTDGVDGTELFADQVYKVKPGEATPSFTGTPTREGYAFKHWSPTVSETVTADVTYSAVWEEISLPAAETPAVLASDAPETPAPEAPEAPAPEAPETPAPETPETPAPETPETSAPEAPEAPAPEAPEAPAPETPESPAPETPESPAPETPESPAPEAPESPAPETPETPAPEAPVAPAPSEPAKPVNPETGTEE